jgi:hypothetical protein
MRRKCLAAFAAAVLWAPVMGHAHEGGIHARGVVTAISDHGLTISTTKGGEESFALTRETRFVAGKRPVTRAEVRAGDRVVVHAKSTGARPVAVEVIGAPREGAGGKP